jgi:chromosome segregation ATPase
MRIPWVLLLLVLAGAAPAGRGQDVAVLDERVQRLTATVEALENGLLNQKRQIAALTEEIQRLREEAVRASSRPAGPSFDELQKLADKVAEVDRKRGADNERVLAALEELKRLPPPAAAARAPRPREKEDKPAAPALHADQAVEYTVERGQSLSQIVASFNAEARKQGYRTLTVDDVMRFNNIADPRRLREGQKLQLPLVKP